VRRVPRIIFVSTFVLAGPTAFIPAVARAQSQPQTPAQSSQPNPERSPAASPTQPPAVGVFGDFGGERTKLANAGVVLRGHYTAEAAGNPSGGLQQGTAYASELQLGTDVDFGTLEHNGLGTLHFTFTAREGSSLSADAIGNIFTVQEIYGSGLTPRLTELSFDQPFAAKKIDVSFGRVITENDFAASPTYWGGNLYCSFQSNAICGTPIAAPIDSGYDAYPQSTWGARIKGVPTPNFYVEAGAYQVDPSYGLRGNGFNLGFGNTTGTYLPFEAGIQSLDGDKNPTGSLRVGGYYDTSNATNVTGQVSRFATASTDPIFTSAGAGLTDRGRFGYWIQADHLIAGGAGPKARGTAIFASYEYGDPQTALLTNFVDAGIVQHGTFAGRDHDTIALGYAYTNVNPNVRAFETSLLDAGYDVPYNTQEQIGELNYGMQVTPWMSLRPGVQYVWRPSGNAAIKNALVLDLSTSITF
jgi:porin